MTEETLPRSLLARCAPRRVGWPFRALPARVVIAAAVLAVYVFIAIFGGVLAPHSPTEFNMQAILKPPSWAYPFGTDGFGRDVFSRVLFGARISLGLGAAAAAGALLAGVLLGGIAGYAGGFAEDARIASELYSNVKAEDAPFAVAKILRAYRNNRAGADESFVAFARRNDIETLRRLAEEETPA